MIFKQKNIYVNQKCVVTKKNQKCVWTHDNKKCKISLETTEAMDFLSNIRDPNIITLCYSNEAFKMWLLEFTL